MSTTTTTTLSIENSINKMGTTAADNDAAAADDNDENVRILRRWQIPPDGVKPAPGSTKELQVLLDTLPPELSTHLRTYYGNRLNELNEIYLQLGHKPECIFANPITGATLREDIASMPCNDHHVALFSDFFSSSSSSSSEGGENQVATTKRKGIGGTLHRVSLITHPMRSPEKVLGVAVRVGRAMEGLLETMAWESFLLDMAKNRRSLLLVGKPGVGKTTALREIARILSSDKTLNVVVVDKTCEIAGDGDIPHPAIGTARWMPVGRPNLQHVIMREAVENQTPDVIIVDEISTSQEVDAARTIAQRGVQLVATVHGSTLPEIMNCRERSSLTGGCSTVTLSGMEAERRYDKRKQVLKRSREPVFGAVLEVHERSRWIYHPDVKLAVDAYYDGEPIDAMELRPGRAVSVAAIPEEGCFDYCELCGLGRTCPTHIGGHSGTTTGGMGSSRHGMNDISSGGYGESSLSSAAVHQFSHSPSVTRNNNHPPPVAHSFATSTHNSHHANGGFNYQGGGGGGGGGGHNHNDGRSKTSGAARRRNRRWRAPRGSGTCHKCGQSGHYARDCATY